MVLLVIVIFLALVLYLGIPKRGATTSVTDHVIAGRSLGLWPVFFIGVAEIYSAGTFLGFPGWAYGYGAPVLFSLVAVALSSMMGFWLGPKVFTAGIHANEFQVTFAADKFAEWNLGGLIVRADAALYAASFAPVSSG